MHFTFFKEKRSGGERDLGADRAAIRAYDACSRIWPICGAAGRQEARVRAALEMKCEITLLSLEMNLLK